jgi:ABC1 atypical kinase-like domain
MRPSSACTTAPLRMATLYVRPTGSLPLRYQYLSIYPRNGLSSPRAKLSVHPTRRYRSQYPPSFGACATPAAASMHWVDRPFLLFRDQSRRSRRSHESRSTEIPQLLSTSNKKSANLWSRVVQWLRRIWRNCQDAGFLILRGSEVILRLSPLVLLTPACVVAAKCNDFLGRHSVDSRATLLSDWTWLYTRSAITALGPAFVKLFQWVATRRDIFPPNVCDRLSVLHDRGVPHAWRDTVAALTKAFGDDYNARGLCVERDSVIGCGSAAQVYKGTLVTKDGVEHRVAVKVLHPLLQERVLRDLRFVRTVAF